MSRLCSLSLGLAALLASAAAVRGEGAKPTRTDLYGDPLPPGAVARLGTVRLRHANADVAFTKDGKQLISCDRHGEVRTWNVATGKLVRRQRLAWKLQEREVTALSPDGSIAVTRDGAGGIVYLYDTSTGKERGRIPSISITFPYLLMRFSADATFLALQTKSGGDEYSTQIWDVNVVKKYRTLTTPADVKLSGVAFTPDDKRLAGIAEIREKAGHPHFDLFLWDTVTGKLLRTRKNLRRIDADAMVFSPDGETLALGSSDEAVVRFLSADTLKDKSRLKAPASLSTEFLKRPAFSPDGRHLAAIWGTVYPGQEGFRFSIPHDVLLWDLAETKEPRRLPACGGVSFPFAPDSKTLACRGEGEIRLYDVDSGRLLHHRPGHGRAELTLAVSPNGKIVASGDHDGIVRLWDAATSKQLWRLEERKRFITDCLFSADGKRVAAGNTGGPTFAFQAWDVATGKTLGRMENEEGMDCLYAVAVSVDGKRLAGVYSNENPQPAQLAVWDLASSKRLRQRPYRLQMLGDTNDKDALGNEGHAAFAPDGERLTVWLGDRVGIVEVSTGGLLAKLPKGVSHPLGFSPDGRFLVAMIRQAKNDPPDFEGVEVRSLIETASGEEIVRLELKAPNKIAFTPDSRGLVVSDRRNLCVWDTVTGKKLHQRAWPDSIARTLDEGGYRYVPSVVALPGGRVAASMAEGDIVVWDVETATWTDRAAKRELGRAELKSLWSDLASDARTAYRALDVLAAAPTQTMIFFQEHLRPAAIDKRIEELLADLDSDSFVARERASRELARLYSRAGPVLRHALANKPSLEMRRRIEAILPGPNLPTAETLRTLRAIAVLERIGTPEARRILEKLAGGAAAPETCEAKAALIRLNH